MRDKQKDMENAFYRYHLNKDKLLLYGKERYALKKEDICKKNMEYYYKNHAVAKQRMRMREKKYLKEIIILARNVE